MLSKTKDCMAALFPVSSHRNVETLRSQELEFEKEMHIKRLPVSL